MLLPSREPHLKNHLSRRSSARFKFIIPCVSSSFLTDLAVLKCSQLSSPIRLYSAQIPSYFQNPVPWHSQKVNKRHVMILKLWSSDAIRRKRHTARPCWASGGLRTAGEMVGCVCISCSSFLSCSMLTVACPCVHTFTFHTLLLPPRVHPFSGSQPALPFL